MSFLRVESECAMFGSLVCVAVLVAAAEPGLAPGTQLHYKGSVALAEQDSASRSADKSFDLTVVVARADDDGAAYAWLIDERGAGAFGWCDRVGRWGQNAAGEPVGAGGPALLFDYGTGKHAVPLLPLIVPLPDAPELGAKWERDELEYEIVRAAEVDRRRVWEVEVRNQFGRQKKLWVEPGTNLALRYEARVFMNQGTEYLLQAEAVGIEHLSPADAQAFDAGATALLKLRSKMKRPARGMNPALSDDQRRLLGEGLAAAKSAVKVASLERIVAAAERDFKDQTSRAVSLDELTAKQVGREVAPFQAAGAGDAKLSADDLRDRVTVIHFWEYRDTPLVEPYGQVGYLEFLYGRRQEQGLRVVGVAVDGRFMQADTAGAAAAGVRRLRTFMNLSYPIVYDGGDMLRKFGDPRAVGGTLPLFVVVGRDGKIAHYKAGHYAVDREAGLKQLDDFVAKLLAEQDGPK